MTNQLFRSLGFYCFIMLTVSCKVSDKPSDTLPPDEVNAEIVEVIEEPVAEDTLISEEEVEAYEPRVYQASRTRKFDLLHTKLDIAFDWAKQHVLGEATLDIRPYFYPQSNLILDAKGFDIHAVTMLGAGEGQVLEYVYDNYKLDIALGQQFTPNDTFSIQIEYTAKPNEMEAGGSAAITSAKGLYFINPLGEDPDKPQQIWTQGETESSSRWFPTIDAPNERTTQEMYITVDEKFTTLSNGALVYSKLNGDGTKTDYWNMELPHAPYLFMVAIGEFAVVNDEWNDLDVDYYVEPAYEKYAMSIFGNTPEMMTFFSELLDYPYPWAKYAQVVVRDFVSGAMENTTASVFMEQLLMNDRELLDTSWDYIIAHELIHQWFGNLVTTESWANLPLNESFANYGEYLWNEFKYGEEAADYEGLQETQQYLNEAENKQVDLIRFYYEDKEDMFDSHSYAKGGRILHMLREYVGDEAFFASLEYYLKENEFSAVEVHDLRLAFEEVTGEDLNWFFNQWFLASGHPEIEVSHQYQDGELALEVWQRQDTEETPIYRLPLYVDIWVDDEKKRFAIEVDKPYEKFEFQVGVQPNLVLFDAEQQLLGVIEHEKDGEALIYQYNNTDKFLSRYEALLALSENIDSLENEETLLKALDDPFWGIRQVAANAFDGYQGGKLDVLEEKLISMAMDDEKSLVRADAISILSSMDSLKYLEVYLNGMQDPSYSVLGSSLYAYGQTNAPDKEAVFEEYEDEDNANIIVPVANYYLEAKKYNKYDWFVNKIHQAKGPDIYYLIQYLGQLMMDAPEDLQKQSAELFHEYAINQDLYYVRLAAFQGLGLLGGLEGVEEKVQDVMVKEKDPRLIQFYENMAN